MADITDTHTGYLSIGEVLGLLLQEFSDITISKIRFLESQGLISPERTASGYRKFYDADVQLLRVILAEQREHYLPLRVIKDRLDSGEIDPTGENLRPNGAARTGDDHTPASPMAQPVLGVHTGGLDGDAEQHRDDHDDDRDDDHTPAEVPRSAIRSHPAARGSVERVPEPEPRPEPAATSAPADDATNEPERSAPQLLPGVLLDRSELCSMVGMSDAELRELEAFGIVTPRANSSPSLYGDDAVEIAKPAVEFLRAGVDARHLRSWRTSAEREASLFDQLVTPRYRQRNPEARAEALAHLRRLDALGASLRAAMTRQALRHHFEA